METIQIIQKPVKTDKGIVNDFKQAVIDEKQYIQTTVLYQMCDSLVRFHVKNNLFGMTIFKPRVYGSNSYIATRITTTGKRKEMGFVEFEPEVHPARL